MLPSATKLPTTFVVLHRVITPLITKPRCELCYQPSFLSHIQCEVRSMHHPLHPVNAIYHQQLAPCATAATLSAL
jgi:hypothetical protein